YKYLDEKTVTVFPASHGTSASSASAYSGAGAIGSNDERRRNDAQEKTFSGRFRIAQTETGGGTLLPTSGAAGSEPEKLEEIVVSAQKRTERLQDVPVPVTAINAQTLTDANQLRLQDYYTLVPGLTVASQGPVQLLSIRGISTSISSNPTVGITIDDVPYG